MYFDEDTLWIHISPVKFIWFITKFDGCRMLYIDITCIEVKGRNQDNEVESQVARELIRKLWELNTKL